MQDSPFGVAFIGCGGYSNALATPAAASDRIKCVGCYDTRFEAAQAFAQKYGMQAYASVDEMLSNPEVGGVIIATPNNAHRENVEQAARYSKHIFVDKPIANTISDANAIIKMAKDAGVILAVGHNGRRHPGHRKMKEMIDSGVIGKPVTVEANFSHSGGLGLNDKMWRFYKDQCPGLPLMQLGVHFADTVQYLLGDVLEVSSFMSHVATPADNNDVTVQLLRFKEGLLGYLGSNYASPSIYYVHVYGTEGNLHCDHGGPLYFRKAGGEERVDVPLTPADSQREELEEFVECAISGRTPEVDGVAAIKALAVVRAALRSNDLQRPVTIQEVLDAEA